jgi:hypothetical protein
MSIALEAKVVQLEKLIEEHNKRIADLERARAVAARESLRSRNATRQAEGSRLRSAISAILTAHPEYATAKHVLRALPLSDLGRSEPPSVRTVQWHIRAVRNAASYGA